MQSFCRQNENRCWAACFSQFCRKSPLVKTLAVLRFQAPSCLPLCLQSTTVLNLPCVWHSWGSPERRPRSSAKGTQGSLAPAPCSWSRRWGVPRSAGDNLTPTWGAARLAELLSAQTSGDKAFLSPFCFNEVTDCCRCLATCRLRAEPLRWSSASPARC